MQAGCGAGAGERAISAVSSAPSPPAGRKAGVFPSVAPVAGCRYGGNDGPVLRELAWWEWGWPILALCQPVLCIFPGVSGDVAVSTCRG